MDKKTRGIIESSLDHAIESLDFDDILGWILDEYPMESVGDLGLGYVLGFLSCHARRIAFGEKINRRTDEDLKKILGKEYVEQKEEDRERTSKEKKRRRPFLTKKDTAEIRDMLRRRVLDIQGRITRYLNR